MYGIGASNAALLPNARKRTQTRAYRVSPRATGFQGQSCACPNLTGQLQPIRRPSQSRGKLIAAADADILSGQRLP